jgi:hypothetical protein
VGEWVLFILVQIRRALTVVCDDDDDDDDDVWKMTLIIMSGVE